MALHHHIPATYLASFSSDSETFPRRQRLLVAGDKKRMTCIRAPAARLGAINDFYAMSPDWAPGECVNQTWERYESPLAEAITKLVAGTVSAATWARTLVPFVACTLVRGIDFAGRFQARFPPDWSYARTRENVNIARLLELQRLLSPVLAADWRVLEAQGDGDLIIGDTAFAPSRSPTGRLGIAIPLDRRHILMVEPMRTRAVLRFDSGSWRPNIERGMLNPGSHIGLAETLARYAHRFLYGPDEQTVQRYLSQPGVTLGPGPWDLGFISPSLARVHEFTWHRVVSMLELAPRDPERNSFELDFGALARGWCPRVFFPTNLPEFAPAVARIGSEIVVHFYEVPAGVVHALAKVAYDEWLEKHNAQAVLPREEKACQIERRDKPACSRE